MTSDQNCCFDAFVKIVFRFAFFITVISLPYKCCQDFEKKKSLSTFNLKFQEFYVEA